MHFRQVYVVSLSQEAQLSFAQYTKHDPNNCNSLNPQYYSAGEA